MSFFLFLAMIAATVAEISCSDIAHHVFSTSNNCSHCANLSQSQPEIVHINIHDVLAAANQNWL